MFEVFWEDALAVLCCWAAVVAVISVLAMVVNQ